MTSIQSTWSRGCCIDACCYMSHLFYSMGDFGMYHLLETNIQGVSKWSVAHRNHGEFITHNLQFHRVELTLLSLTRPGWVTAYPLDEDEHSITGNHHTVRFRKVVGLLESSLLELTSSFTDFRCFFTYNLHATSPRCIYIIIGPRSNPSCWVFTYTLQGSGGKHLVSRYPKFLPKVHLPPTSRGE